MSIYARRLQRNIGEKVEKGNNEESQNTLQVICKLPLRRHEVRCCLLEWNHKLVTWSQVSRFSSRDLSLRYTTSRRMTQPLL